MVREGRRRVPSWKQDSDSDDDGPVVVDTLRRGPAEHRDAPRQIDTASSIKKSPESRGARGNESGEKRRVLAAQWIHPPSDKAGFTSAHTETQEKWRGKAGLHDRILTIYTAPGGLGEQPRPTGGAAGNAPGHGRRSAGFVTAGPDTREERAHRKQASGGLIREGDAVVGVGWYFVRVLVIFICM